MVFVWYFVVLESNDGTHTTTGNVPTAFLQTDGKRRVSSKNGTSYVRTHYQYRRISQRPIWTSLAWARAQVWPHMYFKSCWPWFYPTHMFPNTVQPFTYADSTSSLLVDNDNDFFFFVWSTILRSTWHLVQDFPATSRALSERATSRIRQRRYQY